MPRLLLIDDDEDLTNSLRFVLEKHDWIVDVANCAKDGISLLNDGSYNAVIIDWHLPDLSGLQVCMEYRSAGGNAPIIFLTGEHDLESKESGLDNGGDDYLTKPFELRELLARLRSLSRRSSELSSPNEFKLCRLDPKLKVLSYGARTVRLSPIEFALLQLFFRSPRQIFSSREIFERIWPSDSDVQEGAVRLHILSLRRKLNSGGFPELIKTVRGTGYILCCDEQ